MLRGWQKIGVALLAIVVLYGFLTSDLGQKGYREFKRVVRPITWTVKAHLFHSLLEETPETSAIVDLLKVYQAYESDRPISLRRIGRPYDGGYVAPEIAIKQADALLGYGISDDISFEESVSAIYEKPSWGFDGTCPLVETHHKLCRFVPLCIVSRECRAQAIDRQPGCSSFEEQIQMLGLKDKKLFVKMDIEGNEYDTLPDILQHSSHITGIVLELHFDQSNQIAGALRLLQLLQQDFLLVHVHGNNCCLDHMSTKNARGRIPRVLEMTYINRRLVDRYEISQDQSHPTSLDLPNCPDVPDMPFTIL